MRPTGHVVRAILWGVGVAGVVSVGGGMSLFTISRKVETFVNATISRQVDLAGRTLLAVPPEKRGEFLEWLVRLETAVYVAVLERDSLILYATAFPGFLPVRRGARQGNLYVRDLPIGEVKEVYHPLPGGRTLLYAYPYFEVAAWMRPWFW